MRFYKVNENYLQYLHNVESKIILSHQIIGIPLRLNEFIYFLPIDALDESDYDENHMLRKSTPTILRMRDVETQECYGKCLFSNMFAVPYKELILMDHNQLSSSLMDKKLIYLKKNMNRIMKGAERLFKQKTKGYKQEYLKYTVNFKNTESLSIKWEIEHYGKHYNRFPDSHFFLTNPSQDGITEYYFMNKETKIAKIMLDNGQQEVVKILEVMNEDYAPLECFQKGIFNEHEITEWFKGRGIPSWRDGLDDLLDNLGIKNKDVLLNKAYGLSLSDQYWMNPVDRPLDWNDINFFDHDFNSRDFIGAAFENKILETKKVDFYSPNNTTKGMLKKAWIVGSDKQRYLLKESFQSGALEPLNEILAGMICEVLDLEFLPYSIEIWNQVVLSKCQCFIDKNTELISAYAILKYNDVDLHLASETIFETYINILQKHGIRNVTEKLVKMFILDYLIINHDRHLGNFGIIRNVETLEWIDIAPVFDSGQSMYSQKAIYEMNFENAVGCFFNHKDMDFEKILDIVFNKCTIQINFDQLEKVPEKWKRELLFYQHICKMSDNRIDEMIHGLNRRIIKLKDYCC